MGPLAQRIYELLVFAYLFGILYAKARAAMDAQPPSLTRPPKILADPPSLPLSLSLSVTGAGAGGALRPSLGQASPRSSRSWASAPPPGRGTNTGDGARPLFSLSLSGSRSLTPMAVTGTHAARLPSQHVLPSVRTDRRLPHVVPDLGAHLCVRHAPALGPGPHPTGVRAIPACGAPPLCNVFAAGQGSSVDGGVHRRNRFNCFCSATVALSWCS